MRKKPSKSGKGSKLAIRVKKLEELVKIISKGKYAWESTFDAIMAPVQIVSDDFEILRANLALAKTAAKDITEMIGRKCFEAFAGREKPCEGCPLLRLSKKGGNSISKIQNQIGKREFEASAYPMGLAMTGAHVLHYRDITEETRLQNEVIQQEKMAAIGILAGGVAHEINNPLGGILAFTQLMKRDALGNDALVKDLEEVERAAVRCKKIVADLLDFSRMSKDREMRSVDINMLIEKVFPFVQREIKSMNVELVFDAAAGLPMVSGIPDRLQQVFLNLMTNACHAMPKGGILSVKTRRGKDKKSVEVCVRDTGIGIPNEIRDRVFDPFFTTKEPGRGTGLGLSISYRIVKEFGGEISFDDAAGGGTEFIVKLPVSGDPKAGG